MAASAGASTARARELSERLGEDAKLMEVLLALAHAHAHRRDFSQARKLAAKAFAMAEQADAPAMLAEAHAVLGLVDASTGEFLAAREHFEPAVELSSAGPSR